VNMRALVLLGALGIAGPTGAQDLSGIVARSGAEAWPAGKVPTGTGFFVSTAGHLVTAAHEIAGCPTVMVWPAGSSMGFAAALIGLDARIDVALLQAGVTPQLIAQLAEGSRVASGTLLAIGAVDPTHQPAAVRLVEGIAAGYTTDTGPQHLLELTGTFTPGMSGAPVLDPEGRVAGMLVGRRLILPSSGLAVTAQDIIRFLGYFGIAPQPTAVRREPPAAVLGLIAAKVQCRAAESRR